MRDGLTGLLDRAALQARLAEMLAHAQRIESPVTMYLVDVSRFGEVNHTFGHHHGDVLLQQIASRLRAVSREVDAIGRVGDDEFAVVTAHRSQSATADALRKIQSAFRAPFVVLGIRLNVRASIGAAMAPEHGYEAGALHARADIALRVARQRGSELVIYDQALDPYSADRLALVNDLRRGIKQDQLVLQYQPKVHVRTGAARHVEALVRWQHPTRGLLPPEQFVPLAEETGLIEPLTQWVLRQAVHQCRIWSDEGLGVGVAVNLSATSLSNPYLVDTVASVLRAGGVNPGDVEVEITEGTLMANASQAMRLLSGLRALGVRISIDDFGTGYSSFAYLKLLPIDHIKIDRGFVMKMATNENDAIIVRSIIDLGHNLGLQVIAEGVDNRASWTMLQKEECDLAQGYYMSAPLHAGEATAWLRSPTFAAD